MSSGTIADNCVPNWTTTSSQCSFYWTNYQFCEQWLQRFGFRFTPLPSNLVTETEAVEPDVDLPLTSTCTADPVDTIDPDYLNAIRLNRRHKQSRERLRTEENTANDWFEYVDLSQTETYCNRSVAPSNGPNNNNNNNNRQTGHKSRRANRSHAKSVTNLTHQLSTQEQCKLSQYRSCYGSQCDLKSLIDLETELQLNFDRFCDQHRPRFWPHLPVRINWSTEPNPNQPTNKTGNNLS